MTQGRRRKSSAPLGPGTKALRNVRGALNNANIVERERRRDTAVSNSKSGHVSRRSSSAFVLRAPLPERKISVERRAGDVPSFPVRPCPVVEHAGLYTALAADTTSHQGHQIN
ncbi:hypothetical protein MRX96_023291 [Rhipicephalus microplus]